MPGAVLTPYRKHHTHVDDAFTVDVEAEDDADVSVPVSVGIHVNSEESEGVPEDL